MLLTAATLAAGLAGGVVGALKQRKARKAQQRQLSKDEARAEQLFNRDYYGDYMNSSGARGIMRRVEDTMRKKNANARATAAVTGATPEAVVATQAQNNEAMADAAERIATHGDARMEHAADRYSTEMRQLSNKQLQQSMMDEQGGAQLMDNGLGLIGTALGRFENQQKASPSVSREGGSTIPSVANPSAGMSYPSLEDIIQNSRRTSGYV